MAERGEDPYSQIKDILARTKGQLGEEQLRKEQEEQSRVARMVKDAADMVEGNMRLQKQAKEVSGKARVKGQSGWMDDHTGWGYRDLDWAKEGEVKTVEYQIKQEESVLIPQLRKEVTELKEALEQEGLPLDPLTEVQALLDQAAQALEAKKQELPRLEQEYRELVDRNRQFTMEQDKIAEDNVGFAVNTVLEQSRQQGQAIGLSPEEFSKKVQAELGRREAERRRARDEQDDQELLAEHKKVFAEVEEELAKAEVEAAKEFGEVEANLNNPALAVEAIQSKRTIEKKLKKPVIGKPDYRGATQELKKLKATKQELYRGIINAENKVRAVWAQLESGHDRKRPTLANVWTVSYRAENKSWKEEAEKERKRIFDAVVRFREKWFEKSQELVNLLAEKVISYEEVQDYEKRGAYTI